MSRQNADNTTASRRAVPSTHRVTRSATVAAASNPNNSAQASTLAPIPSSSKDSKQPAAPASLRKVAKKSHNAASTSATLHPFHAPRPDFVFPAEIWAMILEFLYVKCGGKAVADVARLSPLVCYEAEAILYRSPTITTTDATKRFAKTIASCQRRALAVRTLVYQPYGHHAPDAHRQAFRTILQHSPRLSGLNTNITPVVHDQGKAVLELFRGLHLRLKRIGRVPFLLSEGAAEVLRTLKDLEELCVHGDGTPEDTIVSIQQLGLPRLRILEADATILQLSMHAPLGNLTHLFITTPCDQASLTRYCTVFGRRLVSLRVRRELGDYSGRMYPTRALPWARMRSLKYLQIEDIGRSVLYLAAEEARFESPHPPVLETLLWTPAWTRGTMRAVNASADGDSEGQRRVDVRRFAKRVLQTWPTLKLVVYGWRLSEGYQCWISPKGRGKECAATPEQLNAGAWARVSE
ncbi:hypothetical protein BD413DRAFT_668811 [Trametes elegans]|nr:hypothetical protein BD413DRAFT_668811 [Trametes elegans]